MANRVTFPHAVLLKHNNYIDEEYIRASSWCDHNVGPYSHNWVSKTYHNQIYFCFTCHRVAMAFAILFGELVDGVVLKDICNISDAEKIQDNPDFSRNFYFILRQE